MPRLEDFRDMIDGVHDPQVLESGQILLREMMEINSLRRRLEDLEGNIAEGGKAIFYFFAEELDEDEIVFAAERISGRIKRIQRIEASAKEEGEKDSNTEESNSEDE